MAGVGRIRRLPRRGARRHHQRAAHCQATRIGAETVHLRARLRQRIQSGECAARHSLKLSDCRSRVSCTPRAITTAGTVGRCLRDERLPDPRTFQPSRWRPNLAFRTWCDFSFEQASPPSIAMPPTMDWASRSATRRCGSTSSSPRTRRSRAEENGSRQPIVPALRVQQGHTLVSPRTAFWITDVLSDPEAREYVFGRGGSLEFPFPVAVKTGTSQAYHDNWTIGYSRHVTVGVWVGNFDRKPLRNSSGVTGAGPIFHAVMLAAERRSAVRPEENPSDPRTMRTWPCSRWRSARSPE